MSDIKLKKIKVKQVIDYFAMNNLSTVSHLKYFMEIYIKTFLPTNIRKNVNKIINDFREFVCKGFCVFGICGKNR